MLWEIPPNANKTGLVGFLDDRRTLVISVEDSSDPSDDNENVMERLKGQYTCRDSWSSNDVAKVTLVAPC